MASIRALVIDDESLARKGLKLRLEMLDEIEVVGESSDGRSALNLITELKP
ncbi:MAG: two-component system LytT family response regulator, partial [Planctomycetaceae bacterium]